MGFRTKLDYSDNRQIKQRERSFTNLSGGTVFGVAFSALTTGVDPNNSGITESYTTVVSTFSGNATTTNFTWYDPRMDVANSSISAITSSNSGITQNTGDVFVVSSTGTTADGYDINLEYTGTSFDLAVSAIFSGAGPVYSGTVTHNEVDFLSAGTLDYKDRTIWIDNPEITRTNRLIVTNNPSVGYVLTCDSVEGEATWSPVSAATSGSTFWEEGGTGNTSLKDEKGSHTLNGTVTNGILAGGFSNTIDDSTYSFIGGGLSNTIEGSSDRGSILGGFNNTMSNGSDLSTIIGGEDNTIDGSDYAGIFGGYSHLLDTQSSYSVIAGGYDNNINGAIQSGIFGGSGNTISTDISSGYEPVGSAIIGGKDNIISSTTGSTSLADAGAWSVIAGGSNNTISGHSNSFIGGGSSNIIDFSAGNNFIIGGIRNTLKSSHAGIIGTEDSIIEVDCDRSLILGGNTNIIHSLQTDSAIIAGDNNVITGNSTNSGLVSIGTNGAYINDGDYTALMGGDSSSAITSSNSVILGGNQNTLDNTTRSAIIGGFQNTLDGTSNSVILGGQGITATDDDTVYMNNLTVTQPGGILYSDMDNGAGALFALSGSSNLVRHQMSVGTGGAGTGAGGSVGIRAWDDVTFTSYGQPGDMHIYAGISSNGLNIISADGGGASSGADYIRFYAGQDASGTADMHIQGTGITQGYVGIATESPTQRIDVDGNGRFRNIGSTASAGALHYDATGVLTTNTSDERMKDEIITIDSALEKIKQLRGVYYKWKEDIDRGVTDNTRIGFIAQEVEKIVPELTFRNERTEDKLMGVHYQDVTALLVEAIKELIDSGLTDITKDKLVFETQTIASEDNNIELNYGGTHESSLDGGLTVVKGVDENNDATLMIDSSGDWTTNTHLKPNGLVIPEFTPASSNDNNGKLGEVTRDDEYLYIKTKNGWKRTGLETF